MLGGKSSQKIFQYIVLGVNTAKASHKKYHLANSFLGILNGSPKTSYEFPDLTGSKSILWRLGFTFFTSIAVLLKSFLYWPKAIKKQSLPKKCDVLFVSHLTNVSHLEMSSDFYFGNVSSVCRDNGLKPYTLLINHCKATRKTIKNYKNKDSSILLAYLSPLEELKIFMKLFLASFSLPNLGNRKFFKCASLSQFDHRAIANARIHEQVNTMLLKLNPKVLVQTFEGHGWERMNALSAHSQSKPIKVIGYHHAVLFPGPRAIDFTYGNGADPDIIMMAGKTTQQIFRNESEYKPECIAVLGSVKHVKVNQDLPFKLKYNLCLIIPEGDINEVRIMAEVGIETAKVLPGIKFVLRLHPLITINKIKRYIPKLTSLPKNFFISADPLEKDIESATWLLYRASSVVFYGMSHGLRPVYFNGDKSIKVNDPVPNSITYRKIVDSSSQLADLIKCDISGSALKKNPEKEKSITFANEYYTPLKPSVIVDFVQGMDH